MANDEHLRRFRDGVDSWNAWRKANTGVLPDLIGAVISLAGQEQLDMPDLPWVTPELRTALRPLFGQNFNGANLSSARMQGAKLSTVSLMGVDFSHADLTDADLSGSDLRDASLSWAKLRGADLSDANLTRADFNRADGRNVQLQRATMSSANLVGADLTGGNLRGAGLVGARMLDMNLSGAQLSGARVYGASIWNVDLTGAEQESLVITDLNEATITVDNLKIAQFVYLILNNREIRDVINTLTTKVVLILGRFSPQRKAVLDGIRELLRCRNYLPILFDFDKPRTRDITETVSALAHLSRFVIADITDAKSIPQELQSIVPNLPSVPIQPLLFASSEEYGMFEHFRRYSWVLETFRYASPQELVAAFNNRLLSVIESAATHCS